MFPKWTLSEWLIFGCVVFATAIGAWKFRALLLHPAVAP